MKRSKISAAVCAAAAAAALLAGCSGTNSQTDTTAAENDSSVQESSKAVFTGNESQIKESIYEAITEQEMVTETRPIAEGDDFAINKINNKTSGDTLPGGYTLQEYSEENQGKLYTNGKSRVVIRAYNYKEDLQAMDIWADNACAMIKIGNITAAQDTVFEDPVDVKVCGFDGIKYDYQMIQYDFLDPDDPNAKTELYRYSARAYFFYSDQDAYILMFDTKEEDWEEQSACFEEFVADLEVTATEY